MRGDLQNLYAALDWRRPAARVLEVRDRVEEACAALLHYLFEFLGDDAVVVRGDADAVRALLAERKQSLREGRRFDEDRAARVDQRLGYEVDRLAGTVRQKDIFRLHPFRRQAVRLHAVCYPFAQIQQAEILLRIGEQRRVFEYRRKRLLQLFDRIDVGRRLSGRERYRVVYDAQLYHHAYLRRVEALLRHRAQLIFK